VSTFAAAVHPMEPMSGHILPVLISWQLSGSLSAFSGAYWSAWERGSQVSTDVFAPGWKLWAASTEPLESLRAAYSVPPLPAVPAPPDEHVFQQAQPEA